MESFTNSFSTLTDFEFKYIPKKEFEKMVTRVERERKLRDTGIWGNFCSVTSGKDDDEEIAKDYVTKRNNVKFLTDDEIQSVIQSIDKKEIMRRIPSSPAPFFGPARKLDIGTFQRQHEKHKNEEESSEASSVHIVEEVNEDAVAQQALENNVKNAARNQTDDVGGNDGASESLSVEDKESLQSELLQLCCEIENLNGTKSSGDESSVDLIHQEEMALNKYFDKTEQKIFCKEYSKFTDKKFDFLYDECKNSDEENEDDAAKALVGYTREGKNLSYDLSQFTQTLPVVELRQKSTKKLSPDADFTNDNNVWIPKTENQIRKSGKEQEREKSSVKKKRTEVFPSDVIIRKAREVGKLKRNEKSQVDVKAPSNKESGKKREAPDEKLQVKSHELSSKTELVVALGKISLYQNKICQYLNYLQEIIEEPPELEDKNDLKKRQTRATEFSNRFVRNHLYQIGHIAEKIRLMPGNPVDLATKVNFLFQVIMQAVQTYLKNVEMIIYNHCPDKLLVLIDFIINAMKVCFDRMVFDKRDLPIQQMMRKCLDMKKYLEMNQQSFAKFASISESRKSSLFSRGSFAFETPYGSKLSMYDSSTKLKPSTSRGKQRGLSSNTPYDVAKPRNLNSSCSHVSTRSKVVPSSRISIRGSSKTNAPSFKRSLSNVSTAMQKVISDESNEALTAEKPLEQLDASLVEKSKEMEIMEMMQNIAKEKIQEMLMPFLSELIPMKNAQQAAFETPKTQALKEIFSAATKQTNPSPRVTCEIENSKETQQEKIQDETVQLELPQNKDRVQHVAKNIQYLFAKSNEKEVNDNRLMTQLSKTDASNDSPSSLPVNEKSKFKVLAANEKPPIQVISKKLNDEFMKKMKEQTLKERLEYVTQMTENPLYTNEMHSEPWKLFAEIADQILDEQLKDFVSDLDFGEKTFVEKFLQHELGC